MIPDPLSYSYAFVLGLLSSTHCVGMCGGITSAFSFGVPASRTPLRLMVLTITYNIGRIVTYTAMGLLLGNVVDVLRDYLPIMTLIMRFVAGIVLVVMGLYLTNVWHGLTWIEKLGQHVWRFISPLSKKCFPIHRVHQAFSLGLIWGFLPCGLVYSMLVWASSAITPTQSAMIMFCFGLGTLPTLITLGLFSNLLKKSIQSHKVRSIAGIFVIMFGLWTLWFALPHRHDHTTAHDQMEHVEHTH